MIVKNSKLKKLRALCFCLCLTAFTAGGASFFIGGAFAYDHLINRNFDDKNDFEPSDLKLITIEKSDGKPFLTMIRNEHTGRQFEYMAGDYIGNLEVYKIENESVELRDRLTKKSYVLSFPAKKIEDDYSKAKKKEVEDARIKAEKLYKDGEKRNAIEEMIKVVNAYPLDDDAIYFLGLLYYETGIADKADECFERALQINPRHYKCMYYLAQSLAVKNQKKEALKKIQSALEIKPDYEDGLKLRDQLFEEIYPQIRREKEQKNIRKVAQIDELKKNVTWYGEKIREFEQKIAGLKNDKKKRNEAEIELNKYKMLYDNNSKLLDEALKKQDQ